MSVINTVAMRRAMPGIEVRITRLRARPIGADALVEFRLNGRAGALQGLDHRPVTVGHQGIEGLGETRLLHGDQLGDLAPTGRERLEPDLIECGRGVQVLGHALSKARDEGCVQPVGLGDLSFSRAEGPDPARIDQGDRDGMGIGTDRLQGDAQDAARAQGGDQAFDAGRGVVTPERLGGGMEPEVEEVLADIDAGHRYEAEHGGSCPVRGCPPQRDPTDCSEYARQGVRDRAV